MDKEKLTEQARVMKSKTSAAMSEIKENFKSDEGATGARKIQSRFVNLWKSGTPGRVRLIASSVAVLLLLVLAFSWLGRGREGKVVGQATSIAPTKNGKVAKLPEQNKFKEILALAKKSAEKDNNINFCGFFTGMSRYDAQDLARHYKLEINEYSFTAWPGKAVSVLWFSPKGVRRMTDGGSTIDELAQAVAKRVGDLKERNGNWERRTIDGFVVTFSNEGLTIRNDSLASQTPLATAEAARKDRADKEQIPFLIRDMIAIPGKSFKMGKYEVTQAQWQAVMGENPSCFKGDLNPVERVSWDDCKKFLEKLNSMPEVKASGLTFRLPTEKEWEYACRAGSTGAYCKLADGTEITESTLGEVAWYKDNSGDETHPVGQKKPNAFGLYDMHGNVWEWCEDLYRAGSSFRVRRGGGWVSISGSCTAGYRDFYRPDRRGISLGFRLAASQDVNR